MAFLINHHWRLEKDLKNINFRNIWMVEGKTRLLNRFSACPNWPLRGLYWISKELFDGAFKQSTGPDARELYDIRNALEHRYIQVREGWATMMVSSPPVADGLGLAIDSDVLEVRAMRVIKIARSALIHLALAISEEERSGEAATRSIVASMPLYELDDRHKRSML